MTSPIRNLSRVALVATVLLGSTAAVVTGANAATEGQKLTAIDNGLVYLASQQQAGGYWNYGGYEQAATGAALTAFLSQKANWGSNAAAYQTIVDNGMAYLLSGATTNSVSTRNDAVLTNICPGGSGSCTGVYWNGAGEATYTTGLVATAIGQYGIANPGAVATSSGPLAGLTWTQIAQGITNEFAAGQSTALNGNRQGGWRYFPGSGDSDSSTTQWAVLSMIYDQSLGATTPSIVTNDLKLWLAASQAGDGSACYQPLTGPCEAADTGGMLLGLKFVGDSASDPAVVAALNFINNNWTQGANNTWYGNFGQPYAMWADYKALEVTLGLGNTTAITNLASTCGAPSNLPGTPPGSTACNWYQDYNDWLVNNQNGDGSWSGYAYWTGNLATAFDVSILAATQVPVPEGNVPEPATIALLGAGLIGLVRLRRRKAA